MTGWAATEIFVNDDADTHGSVVLWFLSLIQQWKRDKNGCRLFFNKNIIQKRILKEDCVKSSHICSFIVFPVTKQPSTSCLHMNGDVICIFRCVVWTGIHFETPLKC